MTWLLFGILSSIIVVSTGEVSSNTVNQAVVQQQQQQQQQQQHHHHQQQSNQPPWFGWAPGDQGFTIQTGYEGYLVPTGPSNSMSPLAHSIIGPIQALNAVGSGAQFLHSLIPHPKFAMKLILKIGMWFFGFLFFLLLGGLFTTAVCALTPICTISFLGLGFNRESMRSYLTPDRLTNLTTFATEAIDKYSKLQKKRTKVEKL